MNEAICLAAALACSVGLTTGSALCIIGLVGILKEGPWNMN